MKKTPVKSLQKLLWLTQLGVSLIAPPLGCLWLAGLLEQRLGWGVWVRITALFIGLVSSGCAAASFLRYCRREADDAKKEKPVSFNDHS